MKGLIAMTQVIQKETATDDWYALVRMIQAAGFESIPAQWKIQDSDSTAKIDAKIIRLRAWFEEQCPPAGENE